MEKSVPSAKKKFSIRDIMTIAAMMVICFIIMMVMSSLTLPFPLVYLYGSAGIDGFICAVFFLVAANRVNKHGLLFAWAGIYGLIQGVMGYMFLFPYFLAVGLIAELSMLGKDTYRNPLRTRIGWTINCVGNFVGCAVPLWWAWDSYTAMALESGFTSETLEMQMAILAHKEVLLWHRKKRARKKPVWLGVWNWHHNIRALFLSQAFLPQQPQCALSYRIFLSIL